VVLVEDDKIVAIPSGRWSNQAIDSEEGKRRSDLLSPPVVSPSVLIHRDAYESLLNIRYQLLQRTLCAAITANDIGVSNAWMVVQHFGNGGGDGNQTNLSDFNSFVTLVGNAPVIEGIQVQIAWADDYANPITG
jgi:hypothetical protein